MEKFDFKKYEEDENHVEFGNYLKFALLDGILEILKFGKIIY